MAALAASAAALAGCQKFWEDNGTHLAYALEGAANQLRASTSNELTFRYETLDGGADPYYVEITPSLFDGTPSDIWSSYLVVSGTSHGGTSYHNRFVFVPKRFYVRKTAGGPTEITLSKVEQRIEVVAVR